MIIYQPVDRSHQAPIKNIDKLIDLIQDLDIFGVLDGGFYFLKIIFMERKAALQGRLGILQ